MGFAKQIFHLLDKSGTNVVSRVEFSKIVEAVQQEESGEKAGVEPPAETSPPPSGETDIPLNFTEFCEFLRPFEEGFLEDVLWFTESVIKVEAEMKEKWRAAVKRWSTAMDFLHERGLASIQTKLQSGRIAKWVAVRVDPSRQRSKFVSEFDRKAHLGFSLREVEILLESNSPPEVENSLGFVEIHVKAFEALEEISKIVDGTSSTEGATTVIDLAEAVRDLHQLMQSHAATSSSPASSVSSNSAPRSSSPLASPAPPSDSLMALCWTLAKAGALPVLTAALCSSWAPSAKTSGIDVDEAKRMCDRMIRKILEWRFDLSEDAMDEDVRFRVKQFCEQWVADGGRDGEGTKGGGRSDRTASPLSWTAAHWISAVVSCPDDYERGRNVDSLVRWDRRRLTLSRKGRSLLLSTGVLSVLLRRLCLDTYHGEHESRIPIRLHLLRLIIGALVDGGEDGRRMFRDAEGMRAFAAVLRGRFVLAERRVRLPPGYALEELDFDDLFEGDVPRLYDEDFADEPFVGSKDRSKVVDALLFLMRDDVWGASGLGEEIARYPDVFCSLLASGVTLPSSLIRAVLTTPNGGLLVSTAIPLFGRRVVARLHIPLLESSRRGDIAAMTTAASLGIGGEMNEETSGVVEKLQTIYGTAEVVRLLAYLRHWLMSVCAEEGASALEALLPPLLPIADSDVPNLVQGLCDLHERHRVLSGVMTVRRHSAAISQQIRDWKAQESKRAASSRPPTESATAKDEESLAGRQSASEAEKVGLPSSEAAQPEDFRRLESAQDTLRPGNPTPPSYYSPTPLARRDEMMASRLEFRAQSVPPQNMAPPARRDDRRVAFSETIPADDQRGGAEGPSGSLQKGDRNEEILPPAAAAAASSAAASALGAALPVNAEPEYLHRPYSAPVLDEAPLRAVSDLSARGSAVRPDSACGFLSPAFTPLPRPFSSLSAQVIGDAVSKESWSAAQSSSLPLPPPLSSSASALDYTAGGHPQILSIHVPTGFSVLSPRMTASAALQEIAEALFFSCQVVQMAANSASLSVRMPPFVQRLIVNRVAAYVRSVYPLMSFLSPSPLPKTQQPPPPALCLRLEEHSLMRSLLLRYPNDTLLSATNSIRSVLRDIELAMSKNNSFLVSLLIGCLLFHLCAMERTEVTLGAASLGGLSECLGVEMRLLEDLPTLVGGVTPVEGPCGSAIVRLELRISESTTATIAMVRVARRWLLFAASADGSASTSGLSLCLTSDAELSSLFAVPLSALAPKSQAAARDRRLPL